MSDDKPNRESAGKTLLVAFLLCVFCAIVVSTSAVVLRPIQENNKLLDLRRNVLAAAGMLEEGDSDEAVNNKFSKLEPMLVDFETDYYASESTLAQLGVSVESYDQKKASKDLALSKKLDGKTDIASIKRQARFGKIYVLRDQDGQIEKMILPIHGYGLWSTLYGFVALAGDLNTVEGLGFYSHAETPGLGGEVDNPKWKALWPGKKVYNHNGKTLLSVVKGKAAPNSEYQIDGLSGATLTSRGVNNLIHFWLGGDGFGPFLHKLVKPSVPTKQMHPQEEQINVSESTFDPELQKQAESIQQEGK